MKKLLLLLLFLPSFNFTQNLIPLAENNDYVGIIQAVQDGANINMTDNAGFTALHVASWNGYIDILRFLLEAGANPNIVSKAGNTALRFATPAAKKLLVDYGAFEQGKNITVPRLLYSPNIYIERPRASTPTPIPMLTPVTTIVTNTVSNIVTNISNFSENTVYVSNSYEIYDYPKKSYDILKKISPLESIALHNWDNEGNNSIHQAAREGDLDKIKDLITRGINPKARNVRGDTALRFATENDHFEVIKYLIEIVGLDVNSANKDGTTALIVATFNDSSNIIEYLAYMGANINQTATAIVNRTIGGVEQGSVVNGWTALMAAAQLGYDDSIQVLINSGANLNAVDSDSWNALLFAVQNGYLDTAQLLLQLGINYNIESLDNHTALSLAIDNGDEAMVKLLESVNAISSSVPLVSYEESMVTNLNGIEEIGLEEVDPGLYDYDDYGDYPLEEEPLVEE